MSLDVPSNHINDLGSLFALMVDANRKDIDIDNEDITKGESILITLLCLLIENRICDADCSQLLVDNIQFTAEQSGVIEAYLLCNGDELDQAGVAEKIEEIILSVLPEGTKNRLRLKNRFY